MTRLKQSQVSDIYKVQQLTSASCYHRYLLYSRQHHSVRG